MSDTEQKVWEHDWVIKSLREGQLRTQADVEDVKRDVNIIKDKNETDRIEFARLKTSLESAAKATREAADKSITSRQLWLAVGTLVIAIVAAFAGFHG